MIRTRKQEPEYRLRIFPYAGEQQSGIAFSVETIKEFVSFQYEVLLEAEQSGQEVTLKILGLHAPRSVMPAVGPARGVRIFPGLRGTLRVRVAKPDGGENVFTVKVGRKNIELVQAPKQPFVVFSNEPTVL